MHGCSACEQLPPVATSQDRGHPVAIQVFVRQSPRAAHAAHCSSVSRQPTADLQTPQLLAQFGPIQPWLLVQSPREAKPGQSGSLSKHSSWLAAVPAACSSRRTSRSPKSSTPMPTLHISKCVRLLIVDAGGHALLSQAAALSRSLIRAQQSAASPGQQFFRLHAFISTL